MLANPAGEKFAVVETAVLVSAVLIVLQTHLRFEKDKQGKWSIIMEKKPTDATLSTEA